MAGSDDIDALLKSWPHRPGVINARLIRARDGREVVQMRIEMGLIQMEVRHRPDGETPGGLPTYLDFLNQEANRQGDDFELTEEHRLEVDREFLQLYHRRICWLALREFGRAVEDADHTLGLMDFILEHSAQGDWIASHEQYRPFVLFHRAQAAALSTLEAAGPESALDEIDRGLDRIRGVFERPETGELFDQQEMVRQLVELKEWLREHYSLGPTLAEQLANAVATEHYELAARLRDEMAKRRPSH